MKPRGPDLCVWRGPSWAHLFIAIPLSHRAPPKLSTWLRLFPSPQWQLLKQTLTQGTRKFISSHDVMKLKPPF